MAHVFKIAMQEILLVHADDWGLAGHGRTLHLSTSQLGLNSSQPLINYARSLTAGDVVC